MATVKKESGTTKRRRAAARKAVAVTQPNGIYLSNEAAAEPSAQAIRARAYELFLARGAIHGNDLEDWFTAEQELRAARTT